MNQNCDTLSVVNPPAEWKIPGYIETVTLSALIQFKGEVEFTLRSKTVSRIVADKILEIRDSRDQSEAVVREITDNIDVQYAAIGMKMRLNAFAPEPVPANQ